MEQTSIGTVWTRPAARACMTELQESQACGAPVCRCRITGALRESLRQLVALSCLAGTRPQGIGTFSLSESQCMALGTVPQRLRGPPAVCLRPLPCGNVVMCYVGMTHHWQLESQLVCPSQASGGDWTRPSPQ